ncbi:PKD domain-containing protein, partial [Candidatus Bipolaricaulota bacterium]|nr:PKD domain-containing protein [Candidatus Bipolaricaulota bacterium]
MPPVITFAVSPPDPHINESVTFNASGSRDTDGAIVSYEWDFDGDGLFDRSTLGPATTHSYSTRGIKTMTLRVTDAEGESSRTTYQFDIRLVESVRLPADLFSQSSYSAGYYTVSQGDKRAQITPLEGPTNAVDYYNYVNYQSNTGLEEANTAVFFLYRDT